MTTIDEKFVLSQFALAFQQEFTDVQPGFFDPDTDKYFHHIFMVGDEPVGCAVFYNDPAIGYFMDWIWIKPEHRTQGLLKAAWPGFLERYTPDFWVSYPRSPILDAFLVKYANGLQRRVAP